jgi:predicted N-formylglutamate amidohydrolase
MDKYFPLLTCEHGGNAVPPEFKDFFTGKEELLQSHRGWDPGALLIAGHIAQNLSCRLISESVSRLVIEQNRSPKSRSLFSEISSKFSIEQRDRLLKNVYFPYHQTIESEIEKLLRKHGKTAHCSIHSFTPVLQGITRNTDVGLLYDPSRKAEKQICMHLQSKLKEKIPGIRVRRNYPYKGDSDGVTRWLRGKYTEDVYCGIEIEINQRLYFEQGQMWTGLLNNIGDVLGGLVIVN